MKTDKKGELARKGRQGGRTTAPEKWHGGAMACGAVMPPCGAVMPPGALFDRAIVFNAPSDVFSGGRSGELSGDFRLVLV